MEDFNGRFLETYCSDQTLIVCEKKGCSVQIRGGNEGGASRSIKLSVEADRREHQIAYGNRSPLPDMALLNFPLQSTAPLPLHRGMILLCRRVNALSGVRCYGLRVLRLSANGK